MYLRMRSAVCITVKVASKLVTSEVLFEHVRMLYWPVCVHMWCFCVECARLQGASAGWWNHRHFQHHAKPNVFQKDPDVNMLNAFVVGKVQPVEVQTHYPQETYMKTLDWLWFDSFCLSLLQYGVKKIKHLPYNHQHKYFFFSKWVYATVAVWSEAPGNVYRIISWFRS